MFASNIAYWPKKSDALELIGEAIEIADLPGTFG